MNIKNICTPGLVVAQFFPNARLEKGRTISTIKKAAESNFYGAMEIADVCDAKERDEIQRLVKVKNLKLNYWISLIQYTSEYSISSIDENERKKAVEQLSVQIPYAIECGAEYVGFFSGPDVDPSERDQAKDQLLKSIERFSEIASKYGDIKFLLESMDRNAHKKHVIGPTSEAIEFIKRARKTVPNLDLNFDTAHIKLLGEDVVDSFEKATEVMSQVHLANCVDNTASPLFGDNHMPFGEPGFLTQNFLVDFLRKGLEVGFLGKKKPVISSEIYCAPNTNPWEAEKKCREFIISIGDQLENVN